MKPIPNSIAAQAGELAEWRQDFHRHPELRYEEHRTAAKVAERLTALGFDGVETGIGGTGVLGVLHGRGGPGGEAIMLRADMDALPIEEATGAAYASTNPGTMHACGHDGHTTMLLGAARHLAETRNFDGTVYFCFQPAEEGGGGAKAMLDDGLFPSASSPSRMGRCWRRPACSPSPSPGAAAMPPGRRTRAIRSSPGRN
jgi:hippurate hydrolase